MPLTRDQLPARIARELPVGSYVKLGIGLPTPGAQPRAGRRPRRAAQRERILGLAHYPTEDAVDPDSSTPARRP